MIGCQRFLFCFFRPTKMYRACLPRKRFFFSRTHCHAMRLSYHSNIERLCLRVFCQAWHHDRKTAWPRDGKCGIIISVFPKGRNALPHWRAKPRFRNLSIASAVTCLTFKAEASLLSALAQGHNKRTWRLVLQISL